MFKSFFIPILVTFIYYLFFNNLTFCSEIKSPRLKISFYSKSDEQCNTLGKKVETLIKDKFNNVKNFEEVEIKVENQQVPEFKEKAKEGNIDKVIHTSISASEDSCIIIIKFIDISSNQIEKIKTFRIKNDDLESIKISKNELNDLFRIDKSILRIITKPEGCDIFINRELVGKSPISELNLSQDDYKIEIVKTGYNTITRDILLFGNEDYIMEVKLDKMKANNKIVTDNKREYSVGPLYRLTSSDFGFDPYHFITFEAQMKQSKVVGGFFVSKAQSKIPIGDDRIFGVLTEKSLDSIVELSPFLAYGLSDKNDLFFGPFISPNVSYTSVKLIQNDTSSTKNPFLFGIEGGLMANLKIIHHLSLIFTLSYTYTFNKKISFVQNEGTEEVTYDSTSVDNLNMLTFMQGISYHF